MRKNWIDKRTYPIPRLLENYLAIKETYELLNEHVKLDIPIHPAGEWLLDNFYIIEEVVKQIKQNLSVKKYKSFLGIQNGKDSGKARIYVLASEIISQKDNIINADELEEYLKQYQEKEETLNMEEIWNIGVFLQIQIIENIRLICEKIYIAQVQKFKVESILERLLKNKKDRIFKNLKINKKFKLYSEMKYPFIEYMSYKLKKYGKKTEKHLEILEEEVEKCGLTVEDAIKKEHYDIAIQKVKIGDCITSIKKIQRINFLEIFEKINGVEEILKSDPANVYKNMDIKTKDYYRQEIKEIAKKTRVSELYIAKKLLELSKEADGKAKHIGYYLFGNNKNILYKKIGVKPPKELSNKQKVKYYIILVNVLVILAALVTTRKLGIISFLLLIFPVFEVVLQIAQYVLGKIVKPKLIPKIDFYNGIDKENKTIVVIPTILKNRQKVKELMKKLEVYYLANKSENLYFCLLGDAAESSKKVENFDKEIVDEGQKQVEILNNKYEKNQNEQIFGFIYRKRKWNDKEQNYLGWERKRGALTEFVELLRGKINLKEQEEKFWINTFGEEISNKQIKYVITLDSDTELILNSAFELVGTMAHILNKPEIQNGVVSNGYGLIQPRVAVNINVSYKNLFTKIFAGSGGIDSYTNAISDLYQDNFGEGIFTGKGIFDVEVFSEILKNEIPENTVLSHDLLEGSYLRCGLASDILLMDGYPGGYMSFIKRLSRWIRGDWQIIRWLKSKKINLLSKYKIFDNLRRSLFEFITIIGILYFMFISKLFNRNFVGIELFLVLSFIMPFLLEIINKIIFKREGERKQESFTPRIGGIIGAFYRAILTLGASPHKAYISLKSIITSIYRMTVSKCKLLEWTTSEDAEKLAKTDLKSYYFEMVVNVIFGIGFVVYGLIFSEILQFLLGILWIMAPFFMWYVSRDEFKNKINIKKSQKEYLIKLAKDTFRYFKDNLTQRNNFLIPDNYQDDRKEKYVDRTSSTNIGLSMLAVISGVDLGFISKKEGLDLLEKIIQTVESLEKWNGHLYNWYNIKTKVPLIPRYISTVDSGNFVGYLYVVKEFFEENSYIDLANRVSKIIENTDFSKLYSEKQRLFSIGFNIEENKLTDSYYDLLASEARQASLVAIAKKDVPSKHWYNLSRTLTVLNNKKGLISWSGTAFEYLMPNINIPRYKGTLLDESIKFAIMSQIEYAKRLNIPWGISEAAFNLKDLYSNYQYKAFGIPWLGLKRGLADEMVIASYGSILAIEDKPDEVYKNMKLLEQYGMYNKYGFYESLDLTPSRLKRGEEASVVQTYMAHHQALILLSLNNFLNDNIFQKRFMRNPEIEAVSILLQERMPETFIVTKEDKEKPERLKYQDYENYAEVSYKKIDPYLLRGNIISNENYMVAINQKGEGFSKYKDININRFKQTNDYKQGIFFYFKNIKSKKIWSNSEEGTVVTFMPDQDKMERIDEDIKTTLNITVDSEEAVEIRKLTLENFGQNEEIVEISSVLEPILSSKEQDNAHPAFNNLFLKFDYDDKNKILEVKRKKRGKNEKDIYMLIIFSTDCEVIVDNEFEIFKEKLDERGNFEVPRAIRDSTPFSNKIGLIIEPIIAMRKTIKILPKERVNLNFIISVNENKDVALENLKKYETTASVNKCFEVSKARADAENRYLGLKGKDIILYQKILSYIIFDNPLKAKRKYKDKVYYQNQLWKYGISGDLPIVLVKVKSVNDMYMVTEILKMYEFFRRKNQKVDIIFLDEEKHSYENLVRAEIESSIEDKHLGYMKNVKGGIYTISKEEIDKEDAELLNFVSDIVIDTHKGDLAHSIEDFEEEYLSKISRIDDRIFDIKFKEETNQEDILKNCEDIKYYNEYGGFSPDGKEYLIRINKNKRLPTVWCNIMANEKFGTVLTENMGGYTWYKNSRLNRITSWSNKPFLDVPSEIIYLQDEETGKTFSLGLNPMPDDNNYNVIYGFGYTKYIHLSDDLYQEFEVFVPNKDSIKVGILKLNNRSLSKKKLRIIYYVKPVLGEDEIKTNRNIKLEFDSNANLVKAKNLYGNEFNNIVFLSSSEKIKSYTGNKKFFIGKGDLSNPEALKKYKLDNNNGIGKESCIAIEIEIEIESMSTKEVVLNLGVEENVVDLKNMAYKYSKVSNCKEELDFVKKKWKDALEKIQVYTPVESINIMLNGWIMYQTLSSRLLGKTGFYQSGGAIGFRDQLQDALGVKYVEPEILKNQIILCCKHQFEEGDVEHWWHEETKRGIRTRFSDDLAWLPYAVAEYVKVTNDEDFLDIEINYLKGEILKDNEEERYDLYLPGEKKESIYNHCIKAIDKALNLGERGLPKIGIGDWNDGFSTVGNKGKGESIWLGFFLYLVMKKFIPICEKRQDLEKVNYYKEMCETLRKNLNVVGWDGRWFKRAYTDDGDILGSIENDECRIDSIAQSWSVISGAGDNDKKFISMQSLENHLVDKENGLIKLLDPPFENGKLEPGYIKAYLPGVRENGGQYTHAAIWAIIAEAMLGFGDKAEEFYKMINPIEHARTKEAAKKYKVEPYVISADIYGAGNLSGRGGWTWYTGSAGWYYIAGIEYILGMKIENNTLSFSPCIPKDWKEYSIRYKFGESIYNIKILNPNGKNVGVSQIFVDGIELENNITLDSSGKVFNLEIIM